MCLREGAEKFSALLGKINILESKHYNTDYWEVRVDNFSYTCAHVCTYVDEYMCVWSTRNSFLFLLEMVK